MINKVKGINWYHGRNTSSIEFSLKYIGLKEANEQFGPGFYFVDDPDFAKYYAREDGILLTCDLNTTKLVPLKGKPNTRIVDYLISNAPDLEMTLTDFGENFNKAYNSAFKTYTDTYYNPTPMESYISIWADFYLRQGNTVEFVKNMTKFYDGYIVKDREYLIAVMFNPSIIEVTDVNPIN